MQSTSANNTGAAGVAGFAAAGVTIDLGDGVHSAPNLSGVYSVLLDLARKLKTANDTLHASEIQRAFVASRLRFGAAMVQLREQIPHGRWMQLCTELAHQVGCSTHTLNRAVRVAAEFATKHGELDPEKAAKGEAALEALRNRKQGSNCARAHNLDSGSGRALSSPGGFGRSLPEDEYQTESGSNCARAHNLESPSMRKLEAMSRALSRINEDEDFDDDDQVVVEDAPDSAGVDMSLSASGMAARLHAGGVETRMVGHVGAVGCEQLTFASLASECRSVIDRVVESAKEADPAATRELAKSLRAAADRIDPPKVDGTEAVAERNSTDGAEATD